MHKHPMTVEGAEALKHELQRLKTIERPRIIEAIATARAHGDLKENAEYHAAREQQSFNEGRIQEIETKLAYAEIIDPARLDNTNNIVFGATVHLVNIETDVEAVYQIVGDDEADIKKAKISISSPIARALIGKHINDVVEVHTPSGTQEFEIARVEYV